MNSNDQTLNAADIIERALADFIKDNPHTLVADALLVVSSRIRGNASIKLEPCAKAAIRKIEATQ